MIPDSEYSRDRSSANRAGKSDRNDRNALFLFLHPSLSRSCSNLRFDRSKIRGITWPITIIRNFHASRWTTTERSYSQSLDKVLDGRRVYNRFPIGCVGIDFGGEESRVPRDGYIARGKSTGGRFTRSFFHISPLPSPFPSPRLTDDRVPRCVHLDGPVVFGSISTMP